MADVSCFFVSFTKSQSEVICLTHEVPEVRYVDKEKFTNDSVLLKETKKHGGLVFEVIGLTYEVPEVRYVDKVLAASSHVMSAIGKEVCITAYFGRAQSCSHSKTEDSSRSDVPIHIFFSNT